MRVVLVRRLFSKLGTFVLKATFLIENTASGQKCPALAVLFPTCWSKEVTHRYPLPPLSLVIPPSTIQIIIIIIVIVIVIIINHPSFIDHFDQSQWIKFVRCVCFDSLVPAVLWNENEMKIGYMTKKVKIEFDGLIWLQASSTWIEDCQHYMVAHVHHLWIIKLWCTITHSEPLADF